jgi:hypothetical protein
MIKVKILKENSIRVSVQNEIIETQSAPYEGSYEVIPSTISSIVLECKNKQMRHNVTVQKIPFEQVSNPQGGKTTTIGGY